MKTFKKIAILLVVIVAAATAVAWIKNPNFFNDLANNITNVISQEVMGKAINIFN